MSFIEILSRLLKEIASSEELKFAKDTIKRIFVFLIIVLSAVGINSIVEFLKDHKEPAWITGSLSFAEFILLITDVLWFIKPLVDEIMKTIEDIFKRAPIILSVVVSLVIFVWAASSPAMLYLFNNTVDTMVKFVVDMPK